MGDMETYMMAEDTGSIYLIKSNKCEFTWTSKLINMLIESRLQMNDEFQCHKSKKVELWDKVAEHLRNSDDDALFWVTSSACDAKWRNLMATFRKIKLTSKGQKRRCYWEYFEQLNNAYENNIINDDVHGITSCRKSRFLPPKNTTLSPPEWYNSILREQREYEESRQREENEILDRLEELEKQKIIAIEETNYLLRQLIDK